MYWMASQPAQTMKYIKDQVKGLSVSLSAHNF